MRALHAGESGVLVTFQTADLASIPLAEALNRVRTIPPSSEIIQIARALGISLGD